MKRCLTLACLIVIGCKTDAPESTASTVKETEEQPTHKGRSGKIEFERRQPTREPALPEAGSDTAKRDEGSERWERRRERMGELRQERMAQLDRDGDGTLSPEELKVARAERATQMKERFDTDGDGKLSVSEFGEARWFRRGGDPTEADTDKNGEISQQELEASLEKMREGIRQQWDGGGRPGRGRRGDGSGGGDEPPAPPR